MERADTIVLTRWGADRAGVFTTLKRAQPWLPLFCSYHEPLDLQSLADGQIVPLESLTGRRIVAFCGIGSPEHFRQTLQQLKAEVLTFSVFPDHHPYTRREVEHLIQIARQDSTGMLITTEKDGVRLRRLQPLTEHIWVLRIRATMVERNAAWKGGLLQAIQR
jgi:tetraacyldisaccharide 4'-kinase